MDAFVDIIQTSPVTILAEVGAHQVKYFAQTENDLKLCKTQLLNSNNARKTTPFVNHKIGWCRCEDGKLVSYGKKKLGRTIWRHDISNVHDTNHEKILLTNSLGKVCTLNIKSAKVDKEKVYDISNVISAKFISKGFVCLHKDGNIRVYIDGEMVMELPIVNSHITSIATNVNDCILYYAIIPSLDEYIADPRADIFSISLNLETLTKQERLVTSVPMTVTIGLSGPHLCYFNQLEKLWHPVKTPSLTGPVTSLPSPDGLAVYPLKNGVTV